MSKGNKPSPAFKEMRQKDAAARLEVWSKLSPVRQLEALDVRLGKGMGATKQREKLHELIKTKPPAMGAVPPPGALERHEAQGFDTTEYKERIKAKDRRAAEQAKRTPR